MAFTVTKENLETLLAGDKPVVIDFWAEWCGPCRMIGPVIDELAGEYNGRVVICKCDVDENDTVAVKYGVRNIPTVLFIKGGEVVDRQVGAASRDALEAKVKALL